MLWIYGSPGYGKTIICASLIDYLSTTLDCPLSYYFFSSGAESQKGPFIAMRSWISQMVASHQIAFELVWEKFLMKEAPTATQTDVVEGFSTIVHRVPDCTFVVDGLDECAWPSDNWRDKDENHNEQFLDSLKSAISQTTSRVMIVSRKEANIETGFHSLSQNGGADVALYKYKISPDDVKSDMELFCRSIVDKQLANKSNRIKESISSKMVDRSNGMFLWAKMQQRNLRGGKSERQLEHILDEAPMGLDNLYDENWLKITKLSERDQIRAFSILRWAAFGMRPLTILELTEALATVDDDNCGDISSDELPDEVDADYVDSEIVGLCHSLVEIKETASEQSLGAMTVHLAHFSVKQYVIRHLSIPGLMDLNQNLRSGEAIQSNELGKTCLLYLSFPKVWQPPALPIHSLAGRPFLAYAAVLWPPHIRTGTRNYPDLVPLIRKLFDTSNCNWESWRDYFDAADKPHMQKWSGRSILNAESPMHYAAMFGLEDVVVHLIDTVNIDVQQVHADYGTALLVSSAFGHCSIVKLLLERGADITSRGPRGWTSIICSVDQWLCINRETPT
jgi:hypothetical protein